jgi:multisubunit Na+/H+ antiporter MnhC subunit
VISNYKVIAEGQQPTVGVLVLTAVVLTAVVLTAVVLTAVKQPGNSRDVLTPEWRIML